MKGKAQLLFLVSCLGLASTRHYDDNEITLESYDDAWMNEILPTQTGYDVLDHIESVPKLATRSSEDQNIFKLDEVLAPGDKIDVWGTYQPKSSKFSVNLKDDRGRYLIHVDFRPEYETVLNSRLEKGWGVELRCPFPNFVVGEQFKITLKCESSQFRIFFNDKELSKTFPYRADLSSATILYLAGGSNGLSWDKVSLPRNTLPQDFDESLEYLQEFVHKQTNGQTLKRVKNFVETTESLAIFQWQLLTYIKKQSHTLDLGDETIRWLLHSSDALEKILTSGDVQDDRWKEVVEIIAEIIRQDANAKEGVKLNLAVAIGLTFSTNVHSLATGSSIDGIKRYHNYARWVDEKFMFEPFYTLNAWLMRYVVGSWAEDEELEWARENVLDSHRSPNKIADVCHSMVKYTLYNDDGVSVHHPGFYYYKPVTLEWIHKIGGVCGAISKFGTSMAQAFGIPALPVGQPGHCAYIWLKDGTTWTLGNDISGWGGSTVHGGIQYTWRREAPFMLMMHDAQMDSQSYRLSEKMRIIAESFSKAGDRFEILEDATTICPQNYDAWNNIKSSLLQHDLKRDTLETSLLPTLLTFEEIRKKEKNIAVTKEVKTSINQKKAYVIVEGNSEWVSTAEAAWVEINLGTPCSIKELKIHWWGHSRSKDYDISAEIDGKFLKVRSENDERKEGWFNGWSIIQGWDMKTTKILLDLREGQLDPWYRKYHFGIRQIIILGVEHAREETVSLNKPIETNIQNNGAQLVDGDKQTLWISKVSSSWIRIDLNGICTIGNITLDWNKNIDGKQNIETIVGGSTTSAVTGHFRQVMISNSASWLNFNLTSSPSYSLREIEVVGTCYTAVDILKMKISMAFSTNSVSDIYLKKKLTDAIE